MRLRKKWWARPELEETKFVITNPRDFKGKWNKEFNNDKPIYLELGCGKGRFISRSAAKDREVNYIGVDLKDEVLISAKRTVETEFEEQGISKDEMHVRLIPMDISFIDEVFDENEVDRIHLNFSTPWPKSKHNKRRLSHPRFLEKYKKFLKKGSEIWLKTDNEEFFNDSVEYFKECGFTLEYVTYDLHTSDFEGNIVTEYEEKFSNMDMNIMLLICRY
ncbi:tRNA (guanosine(46)-N7)-methyltransferase TrmB [Clostridium cylindrosporum]|uniref:tRNA (guanine-N(7)-)-methyltransferase n=1 Tax=Clostridium cylindrosporum DSM 605 TaxID=1121307 RepID=A0A0J8D5H6_CLOCY|nr:tRNA (guanosine(46)-N7)-methyltransferase TrmB [Clostridium cylindrosporum]KMT21077.1 tRNA (guanine-N(7)-)-methyltransferase TrmB [Clostridium cylindrosporum DSM 605]